MAAVPPPPLGPLPAPCNCIERCACARELSGGGPVFGLLYFKMRDHQGAVGPLFGGRGYGYALGDQLRIGGMGFGGFFGQEDEWTHGFGYGGVTLEYILRAGRHVELPVGLLLGGGGGGRTTIVADDPPEYPEGSTVVSGDGGSMFALQAMAGLEVNAAQWLKLSAQGTFLYAVAAPDHFYGGGALFQVIFGQFWPDEI